MIGELMIFNYFDNKKENFNQETSEEKEYTLPPQETSGGGGDTLTPPSQEVSRGGGGSALFTFLIFMIQMILIFGTFFYAIYLSFQRNDGFSLIGFLAACYYPIFYIIYAFVSPVA